jgi:hypothetical protein
MREEAKRTSEDSPRRPLEPKPQSETLFDRSAVMTPARGNAGQPPAVDSKGLGWGGTGVQLRHDDVADAQGLKQTEVAPLLDVVDSGSVEPTVTGIVVVVRVVRIVGVGCGGSAPSN